MPPRSALFWLWLFTLLLGVAPGSRAASPPWESFPQQPPGKITSFLQDAGLVQAKIFDIAFEKSGTVWLAASDGLYRFDGYFWKRFSTESGLPGTFVRCVLVTQNQMVWVGTDLGAGTFTQERFQFVSDAPEMANRSVRRISEDPDGTLWFCHDSWPDIRTRSDISSLKDGRWHSYGAADGLAGASMINYFRTSVGEQFGMSIGKLPQQLHRKVGEHWEGVAEVPPLVWSMAEHPDLGALALCGTQLATYKNGHWTLYPCSKQQSRALTVTRAGEIFSCLDGTLGPTALTRWNGTAFCPVSQTLPAGSGLLENLKEAPDGALWAVGDNVLLRWNRNPEWTEFPELPPPSAVDRDGVLWFAGRGEAVQMIDHDVRKQTLETNDGRIDGEGNLWSWSKDEITRLPKDPGGEALHFSRRDIGLSAIKGLLIAADGAPWIFEGEHYAVFTAGAWQKKSLPKTPEARITDAAVDPQGGLWFTTLEPSGTLTAIHSERADFRVIDHGATGYGSKMAADRHGGFWNFGISGLYYWAPKTDHWEKIPGLAGNNVIGAVLGREHLWFLFNGNSGGRTGIGFFDGQTWQQTILDVTGICANSSDGDLIFAGRESLFILHEENLGEVHQLSLPEADLEVRSLVKDRNGTLWVGGVRGKQGSMTYAYRSDGIAPAVTILDSPQVVRHDGRLRVQAIALERFETHQPKKGYRFSSRIDEEPWSPFAATPGVDLAVNGLSSTLHQLSIRCRDEAGEIAPIPATLAFTVLPTPLELRPWFRPAALSVLALIASLGFVAFRQAHRFRFANLQLTQEVQEKLKAQKALQAANDDLERRVEERSVQLEEEIGVRHHAEAEFAATLAERNRLGREIHDTLEQTLASVGLQLSAAKLSLQTPEKAGQYLDLATGVLRQTQIEVRRSVLDMRSPILEKFDLATALGVAAKQLVDGSPIKTRVNIFGESQRFPSVTENALLRIGQEALTNVIKHAQATQIIVELDFKVAHFCLRIKDNGRGFNTQLRLLPDDGHFGLLGMHERAKRIGAAIRLTSDHNGTTVEVDVPIPSPFQSS